MTAIFDPQAASLSDPCLDSSVSASLSVESPSVSLSKLAIRLWHWLSVSYQTRLVEPPRSKSYRAKKPYEVSAGQSITALTRDWCRANGVAVRAGERLVEELVAAGKIARVEAGMGSAYRPPRRSRKRKHGGRVAPAPFGSFASSGDGGVTRSRRRPKVQRWAFRLVERAPISPFDPATDFREIGDLDLPGTKAKAGSPGATDRKSGGLT